MRDDKRKNNTSATTAADIPRLLLTGGVAVAVVGAAAVYAGMQYSES